MGGGGGGKKAEQKKKQKIIDDKTFGLKNKNRSAKVQAYVQQVAQTVNQKHPQDKKSLAQQEARKLAKEEKKAREAELAKLFKDVDLQAQRRKNGGQAHDSANNTPGNPAEQGAEDYMCNPDEYLFRPEDFEEVEKDERRLEEQLEQERQALKERTDLTPVTQETFQRWKTLKRQEALQQEVNRVRKAKAGEGKLRGKDLWNMDQELFVDDEDADQFYDREEIDEEEYDLS